ncbi:MAG TPA: hypothetical protein VH309_08470 [Elusimicrobiota bacterium]|jgi:hypothetical protein|nr:hypothetical protein [Elusimicrobiota bacterium]
MTMKATASGVALLALAFLPATGARASGSAELRTMEAGGPGVQAAEFTGSLAADRTVVAPPRPAPRPAAAAAASASARLDDKAVPEASGAQAPRGGGDPAALDGLIGGYAVVTGAAWLALGSMALAGGTVALGSVLPVVAGLAAVVIGFGLCRGKFGFASGAGGMGTPRRIGPKALSQKGDFGDTFSMNFNRLSPALVLLLASAAAAQQVQAPAPTTTPTLSALGADGSTCLKSVTGDSSCPQPADAPAVGQGQGKAAPPDMTASRPALTDQNGEKVPSPVMKKVDSALDGARKFLAGDQIKAALAAGAAVGMLMGFGTPVGIIGGALIGVAVVVAGAVLGRMLGKFLHPKHDS